MFMIAQAEAATRPAAVVIQTQSDVHTLLLQHVQDVLWKTPLYGWGVLLGGILMGFLLGRLAQVIFRSAGQRVIARGWNARGTVLRSLAMPANVAVVGLGLSVGLTAIYMTDPVREMAQRVLLLFYILAIAWFFYNLVDLVDLLLSKLVSRTESKLDDQLVPLIRKTLRLFLAVIFVLFTAQNVFDANIAAWLAGLGIAGLAVSLAAQDSIKNLFGSVTIFLDRPFAVGDRIVVAGHDGVVEEIGFRSTKIRTLIGHLVTVPNSAVAEANIENIGRRPNIRRLMNVTITYDTPPAKVRQAVQIIRDILAEPEFAGAFDLAKFPPRVYFNDYNADSLNIIVLYWFYPGSDWWAYMDYSQRFNLRLLEAYNDAGIDFAFPTRTLYLAGDSKRTLALRMLSADLTTTDGNGGGDGNGHTTPAGATQTT